MKTATVRELKIELSDKSTKELIDICLALSKFKKENKELLTYLLYEKENESLYIENVKEVISESFEESNRKTLYLTIKAIRKNLRIVKKYIRYSKNKETEIELLLFFCAELKEMRQLHISKTLQNVYFRQIEFITKKIKLLHEDLQFDYTNEIENLSLDY